ncbi:acylphosphatase [Patescibacteria group bacterium]
MNERTGLNSPELSKEKFKRAHIFVIGKVQGVFFRLNTEERAKKLGITGWIKNLEDGRIEAIFEGKKESVEKIIKWTKMGPLTAKVNKADIKWQEYKDEFKDFEIRY